jgi:hypothetical protein
MALLAVIGAVLLASALIVREYQLAKQRTQDAANLERLRANIKETRSQLRRTVEDLHVMQRLLEEKHLLTESDLARGRLRLIERPRRLAAERNAIVRSHGVSPTQLVIDDDLDKVH